MNEVEWEDAARDELADVWVAATPAERERIAGVVQALERNLADDPLDVGESREGRRRVYLHPLLTVWFEVFAGGQVRVFRVRRPGRR